MNATGQSGPPTGEELPTWTARVAARARGPGLAASSAGKIGMWIFLASDVMGFGGLLLAYAMLRVRAASWPDPATRLDRPLAAALTLLLLVSGATMTAAMAMARAGAWRGARRLLGLTAVLGTAFVAGQAVEFRALASARHIGLTADHAAATFYVITGYHGLHVLVGVVILGVLAARAVPTSAGAGARIGDATSARPSRPVSSSLGTLEVASLYWQFVDLVWIVIFVVLYLLPSGHTGIDG